MGSKPSKSRENAYEVALPTKPYHFLEGSHLKSRTTPTMVEFQRNINGNRHLELQGNRMVASVLFLRDERYKIFGSICTDLDTYSVGCQMCNKNITEHNSLTLVNIQLNDRKVLLNQPIRDICLSPSGDHLAVLSYNGYSSLQIWSCNNSNQLNCIKVFEEKKLISHSTHCAFSPNGKLLVTAICSDYFTMRSASHLVVRNVSLGKYSESKEISFAEKQKYYPTGLFISLEFSPDSSLLAVGSTANKLYILCTKTWAVLSAIGSSNGFTSLWGIFHPLFSQELLFSCNAAGILETWQIVSKAVTKDNAIVLCDEADVNVSCAPSFAPNGSLLAVGLSNGNIVIIEPNVFTVLWTINPEFITYHADMALPNTDRICFSRSCQYLLVGYAGEMMAIWLLPQTYFTLKHFCRTVIISNCAPKMISKLPIPHSLKQYLLYQS